MILLQTEYSMEDRIRWNPSWEMPDSVSVDDEGHLTVWYQDGKVHNEGWPSTYFFDESLSMDGKVITAGVRAGR